MSIVLYHHPFSRAANVIWMLEEIGVEYEVRHVDIMKGEQKNPDLLALNPMGKLPTLTDGDQVVTESAAIALYLGDRYAYGRLAPRVDDPARGTYLRWSFFAPSVVEPAAIAKAAGWTYREAQVGWGTYESALTALEAAVAGREYLLGNSFSMADVVVGGLLRYLIMVKTIDPRPVFTAYVDRLAKRPALQRADARNAAILQAHGIGRH